ncbi:hypothetical protein SBOR_7041 [Sclerotinia borealis F-4128]|uniref:rRNA methyltransferase 1, mitochondrial n=1 Tax=Sclerotinia borealis (strain F-4128) TaxID=1432307 RepID=W9C9Q8_SCLBF|nr:hypothetical protein SBOR_7041 [Sclerotinia borealis F-4128]
MSTILLTGARASKRVSYILQPLYSSSCSVRYVSINSGINRGLRKSKGVGFRGKDKGRPSREDDGGGRGFQVTGSNPYAKGRQDRGSADDSGSRNKSMHSRYKPEGRDDRSKPTYKSPIPSGDRRDQGPYKNGSPEKSHRIKANDAHEGESFDRYKEPRNSKSGYEKKSYGARDEKSSYEKKSYGARDEAPSYEKKPSTRSFEFPGKRSFDEKKSHSSYGARDEASSYEKKPSSRSPDFPGKRPFDEKKPHSSYGARDEVSSYEKRPSSRSYESPEKRPFDENRSSSRPYESRDSRPRYEQKSFSNVDDASKRIGYEKGYEGPRKSHKGFTYPSKYPTREERLAVKSFRSGSPSEYSHSEPPLESPPPESPTTDSAPLKFTSSFAKKMPVTIPYTTPASEFLYGTSVVEAALHAQNRRGRKLYKLYILKGEDRQNAERDGVLARLAQKKGVEVTTVRGYDWLRTLDKMSQGRPHNGYILEASPLPRLPLLSLGEVIDQEDSFAIKLALDHQSREEMEINGTDTIIKVGKASTGRRPLVLLLDSIEDPQNLGAILRTAAFMGVTAVAISTRNSASFTPVVFKASAGAAETMELFSVSKTAGFVKDSQTAGWKIYAAVAPPAPRRSDSRYMWPATSTESIWTHDLQDPLQENPCIIMVGGEGEGLRKHLRDLADVHISIKGAALRGKLDSLNVSVATGMLCDAFVRETTKKTVEEAVKEVEEESEKLDDNQIF